MTSTPFQTRLEEKTKSKSILCIVPATIRAEMLVRDLQRAGFPNDDISVLLPDRSGSRDFALAGLTVWGYFEVDDADGHGIDTTDLEGAPVFGLSAQLYF